MAITRSEYYRRQAGKKYFVLFHRDERWLEQKQGLLGEPSNDRLRVPLEVKKLDFETFSQCGALVLETREVVGRSSAGAK